MKKILYLFSLLLILSVTVKAQSADEKAVAAKCLLLSKGLITRDSKLLKSLTSSKLSYGHSNGNVEDQAAFIKAVVDKTTIYQAINIPKQEISVVNTIAIVRQVQELKLLKDTVKSDLKIGNLLIWQKTSGAWKLLVKQGFKL
jgi:hypothetical protein